MNTGLIRPHHHFIYCQFDAMIHVLPKRLGGHFILIFFFFKNRVIFTASLLHNASCIIRFSNEYVQTFFSCKGIKKHSVCPHRFRFIAAAEEVHMLVFSGERRLTPAGLLLAD